LQNIRRNSYQFVRITKYGNIGVLSLRPKVKELTFQLFSRSLHPELFEVFKTRHIQRGSYEAQVDITRDGHVITFQHHSVTIAEVASAQSQPLPQRRRLLAHPIAGERSEVVNCRGIEYQTSFQLEVVPQEIFWSFQQELSQDSELRGMVHFFDNNGRMATGAMSYVNLETRQNSLLIQAFHTFPDDLAIIKSQSVFSV
tara:strand:+ start:522 stop:1118 length:597 start_codon:yes stop_codon:yes gene_type:complete